jgi:delta 1-pyrroline-5-carboxylate dehydrogenase
VSRLIATNAGQTPYRPQNLIALISPKPARTLVADSSALAERSWWSDVLSWRSIQLSQRCSALRLLCLQNGARRVSGHGQTRHA